MGTDRLSEKGHRIHGLAVPADFKMQVIPCRGSRCPDRSNHLSLPDILSDSDVYPTAVTVAGGNTIGMADDHQSAVSGHPACIDDGSRHGGGNRGAPGSCEVDSGVEKFAVIHGVDAPSKRVRKATADRHAHSGGNIGAPTVALSYLELLLHNRDSDRHSSLQVAGTEMISGDNLGNTGSVLTSDGRQGFPCFDGVGKDRGIDRGGRFNKSLGRRNGKWRRL